MEDMVLQKQAEFVAVLSELDGGAQFTIDRHERPNGQGGGITTVLQDSEVFEKAGVNVSVRSLTNQPPLLTSPATPQGGRLGVGLGGLCVSQLYICCV
jgi:coproporphyrinogen III oxidase